MAVRLKAEHDIDAAELDAIEEQLNRHNRHLTGHEDDRVIAYTLKDDEGRTIGIASGYSWAGIAELKLMWVDESCRGLGHGEDLLNAFLAEAANRGARRVWVSTHDFQAPGLYEKAGFRRTVELGGWPEGHSNIILCKSMTGTDTA